MLNRRILFAGLLAAFILPACVAQPTAASPARPAHPPAQPAAAKEPAAAREPAAPAPNDAETSTTQRELIRLLRLSPTLTTVVARDPSLLANQDYVSRNNPQLGAFLAAHPEVARNPDFYLFTHLNHDGSPDEALEKAVWPDMYRSSPPRNGFDELLSNLVPLLAFAAALLTAAWGIRLFVESRRWSRVFKLQSEVHSRLIDKFSTSQELAAYMDTEAGRRFLEAAPISVEEARTPRMPNVVSRVLLPLQIGTVMILLGVGFLTLRHVTEQADAPMHILGMLILMPGIGFILSAGLMWLMAARMGLMPSDSYDADSTRRAPNGLNR